MLAVRGIYKNGKLILNEKIRLPKFMKVIVTFLDDIQEKNNNIIDINQFSFVQAQKILEDYKGSLSDSVINERKSEL
ncbi:MAG TPA: hypothetical protein ENL20_10160 [Candidatus Cloacimonetes bacterium]|nr:hypothetical protein [Candidatus Cloacimonadota bacterium]